MWRTIVFSLSLLVQTVVWASPVNINTASRDRLDEELSGIGTVLADRIVRYREAHGPFRTPDEIQNVPYIGVKTFEKNRHLIQVRD